MKQIVLAGGVALLLSGATDAAPPKCRKETPTEVRHLQSCSYVQYPLKVAGPIEEPEQTAPHQP